MDLCAGALYHTGLAVRVGLRRDEQATVCSGRERFAENCEEGWYITAITVAQNASNQGDAQCRQRASPWWQTTSAPLRPTASMPTRWSIRPESHQHLERGRKVL